MATWKHTERELASRLHGERVPVSGRTGDKGQESPDIAHEDWAIEVKHRGKGIIPKWLQDAMVQAEKSRKAHHLGAIVILHEKNSRHDKDLVMMSFKDFLRIQDML